MCQFFHVSGILAVFAFIAFGFGYNFVAGLFEAIKIFPLDFSIRGRLPKSYHFYALAAA